MAKFMANFRESYNRAMRCEEEDTPASRLGTRMGGVLMKTTLLGVICYSGTLMTDTIQNLQHSAVQESASKRYLPGIAGLVLAYGAMRVAANSGRALKVYGVEQRDNVDKHVESIDIVVESVDGKRRYFIQQASGAYLRDTKHMARMQSAMRESMDRASTSKGQPRVTGGRL